MGKLILLGLMIVSAAMVPRSKADARTLTAAEKAIIISAMNLKDTDSAQFRWLPFNEQTVPVYCGSVNAKNSYGGYIGFYPFEALVTLDDRGQIKSAIAVTAGPDGIMGPVLTKRCGEKGYQLSR